MPALIKRGLVGSTLVGAASVVSVMAFAQAPVVDANSGDLEQRLVILERQVENRTEMQHRLQQQLDTMQSDVDELRGAVELHTNQLEKVLARQRELYLEIDKRVEALKQAGAMQPAVPANNTTPSSTPAATSTPATQDVAAAYDQAVDLILKSKEYDKAIPAFQSFLERFPDTEYSPNAHYWLGQLLFNKQQWAEAAQQFDVVANRFSDSTKRPDALLKMGIIAERQGNAEAAKRLFEQVVSEYPDSSARKLAESRLQ